MKTIWTTVLVLAAIAATPCAHATFAEQSSPKPACLGQRVTQYGTAKPTATRGYGNHLPLAMAARLLLPVGWHSHLTPPVEAAPVTWQSGALWTNALTTAPATVCYVIDWNTRTFYASNDVTRIELLAYQNDAGLGSTGTSSASNTTTPVSPARDQAQYTLRPGSLHAQLATWAEANGIGLSWQAPDVTLTRTYALAAPFEEAFNEALALGSLGTAPEHALKAEWSAANRVRVETLANSTPIPATTWALTAGLLRHQMQTWAKRAHVHIVWQAHHDYVIASGGTLYGSFETAVRAVFASLRAAGTSISGRYYTANQTLVVSGQ